MRKERCSNCGAQANVSRGRYRFEGLGVPVVLCNVDIAKCKSCGIADPIVDNMKDLMDAVARAIVFKHTPLTGHEVRFLRKYLGKSAKDFSTGIGIDPATLSRWENSHIPVGGTGERLVRLVTLNLSPSLKDEQPKTWGIVSDIVERPSRGEQPHLEINARTGRFQYV